jgi:predicted regulator of Ras-like GTPase activity (Roadblock/LC7/MglB family)
VTLDVNGTTPSPASAAANGQTFNWLLANFVRNTDGVRDAIAVSSDGLLIATSDGLDRAGADGLAAIVSGMTSLARTASRRHDFDGLKLIMIEMRRGFLLISTIADGSCVGVLADPNCDVGLIGYEIAVLVDRAGALLTPALIAEARQALSR